MDVLYGTLQKVSLKGRDLPIFSLLLLAGRNVSMMAGAEAAILDPGVEAICFRCQSNKREEAWVLDGPRPPYQPRTPYI